ncbi:hypothetical protein Tco_0961220 [Tanacetum coccineum]
MVNGELRLEFDCQIVRNKHEESDEDEGEYHVKRDEMGKPIYGLKFAKYLKCDDPMDRALALQETLNPFRKILLNNMGCAETIEEMLEIKVYEMGGDEEIFTYEAWRHAFDIREPVYTNLCHEFYATYEFDETFTDEELMSRKVIKFRLGGCGHTLTILEFARHLGLHSSDEIQDDGFETYFYGGLRNDDHFNVNQYWSEISSENALILSRSSARTIRKPIMRVLQKMITYGLCQRKTG